LASLNRDIYDLTMKLDEHIRSNVNPTLMGSTKRLVWAEEMLSNSEVAHLRRVFDRAVEEHGNIQPILAVEQAAAAGYIYSYIYILVKIYNFFGIPPNNTLPHLCHFCLLSAQ
jgi:hypothetical protein